MPSRRSPTDCCPTTSREGRRGCCKSGGIVAGISNPSDLIAVHGTSVAAGYLVDPGKWEIPGTGRPDGAYALFRSDDAVVEIVSDALASRTVWYAKTDDMFVASTSQRAIVSLAGNLRT